MKIAIVGAGVAGVGAAWLLSPEHDVDVYEAEDWLGGHARTVDVTAGGLTFPVDAGFMVFNQRTYPNLLRFFERLGVAWRETDMSFSVRVASENIEWAGSSMARALPLIQDEAFAHSLRRALERLKAEQEDSLSNNPFGVPFHFGLWGDGWNIQWYAVAQYYLVQAFPDLFDRESILRALNYVLGCHSGSDISLVSGVGARSMTSAYGVNRADWSYIPGGVVSGPNLIKPDFPELKQPFPFLWQQAEYVIGGAATYIFCVLAADRLLNG